MRDTFIDVIYDAARLNKDIYFLSPDMGAPALDRFRDDLPGQFVHTGISEQHTIDMAAGLTLSGKQVYVFAMAQFITLRCFEQIKCALAIVNQPVTLIGVGVGLGYDDSGATHHSTEDIACMRAFAGMEVLTPADEASTREIAQLTVRKPALRYIRLDRSPQPPVHGAGFADHLADGFAQLTAGKDGCILASGHMLHRALAVRGVLAGEGVELGVIDLFRIKPVAGDALVRALAGCEQLFTIEEQLLSGGFGSAVLETLNDAGAARPLKRIGIAEGYYFDNGGRDHLHRLAGIDETTIADNIRGTLAGAR